MNKYIKILVVDDERDSRETYKMLLESQNYAAEAVESAEKALEFLEKEFCHIVISDITMPGMDGLQLLHEIKKKYQNRIEVIMATGYGTIESAVEAMKTGAYGYFVKSHNPDELLMEIQKAMNSLEMENMKELQSTKPVKYLLDSKNARMRQVWDLVDLVANSGANVLITGESGTGKEIIAEEIHRRSGRNEKPFIAINCQQYPHNLIESELFGHEKGAYTGAAARRIGKLEQAAGGTVFLDEIGDLDLDVQVMLLRVLEKKEIERIGSNTLIPVDFRLLTATNRPLDELIEKKQFRQDFLYRINTIEIKLPPLRERKEDLPDFIEFFIRKYERETGKTIHRVEPETMEYLLSHNYTGNIREMKNLIERLVILSGDSGVLSLGGDALGNRTENGEREVKDFAEVSYKEAKANFDREYILSMLQITNGNITKAAEKMGMSRRQLFNKIVELQIDVNTMK
jgi:DNA-binding NtrC family response regulator